ncbi:hypothetical protein BTR23_10855 [Alkalihalophilus pseudofirmus]|nr:hypothetical protein BTR23_10855 [Alkalihalophilus pseudofirmus]
MGRLSAVPEAEQCGWIKVKFGLSLQVVLTALSEMMRDPDKENSGRVMQEMLQILNVENFNKRTVSHPIVRLL